MNPNLSSCLACLGIHNFRTKMVLNELQLQVKHIAFSEHCVSMNPKNCINGHKLQCERTKHSLHLTQSANPQVHPQTATTKGASIFSSENKSLQCWQFQISTSNEIFKFCWKQHPTDRWVLFSFENANVCHTLVSFPLDKCQTPKHF